MTMKYALIAAMVSVTAAPVFAQSAATNTIAPIESEAEADILIGAPLDVTASGTSADAAGDTGPLFVITGSNVKAAGEWNEADSQACKAAGGVELQIAAGRIICINL